MAVNWSYFDPTNKGGFRATLSDWDPTKPPQYQGPGAYQSPEFQKVGPYQAPNYYQGGGQDFLALKKALNIQDPVDNRDVMREAVMGQIAGAEHGARVRSDQAAANRGTGAYRSGAQQTALARIGAGYDQQRANAEMGIQKEYADAQRLADSQALQAALAMQNNRNTFNVGNAQFGYGHAANQAAQENQFNRNNAQFAYNAAQQEAEKRFNANEMAPWNQRQALLGQGANFAGNFISLIPGMIPGMG